MKRVSHSPLTAQVLAGMYAQLARLEKSGIPTEQALSLLAQTKNPSGQRARVALSHLKRGKSLAIAGIQAGLFTGIEGELLKLADASGTHETIYAQLAQTYEEKASFSKKVRINLIYPSILLLLAVFLHPLPALISAHISFYEYLLATVGLIAQIVMLIFIGLNFTRWSKRGILQKIGVGHLVTYLEMNLPYLGHWYTRKMVRDFMQALGLMLQAGLPILEALPKAYPTVDNLIMRQRLQVISTRLRKGDSFTEALSHVEDLPALAMPLISTGEYAGSLAEALLRYVKVESADIAMHHRQLAAWLPRLIYAGVVVWIAYHIIIGGDRFVAQLPKDL